MFWVRLVRVGSGEWCIDSGGFGRSGCWECWRRRGRERCGSADVCGHAELAGRNGGWLGVSPECCVFCIFFLVWVWVAGSDVVWIPRVVDVCVALKVEFCGCRRYFPGAAAVSSAAVEDSSPAAQVVV